MKYNDFMIDQLFLDLTGDDSVNLFANTIPMIIPTPQQTWMGKVETENKTRKGPGHNPPMPHPNPKQKAPNTSLKSTFWFFGSNT